jgi:hypothetical protein
VLTSGNPSSYCVPALTLSYGLILLAQLACMIHAGRTGRPYYWFMIILFVPGLGILAYLAVEVLPGLLRGRGAAQLSRNVTAGLDPTRQHRALADAVETMPSVANLRALADECTRLGRYDEAVDLYKKALTGLHETDPGIMMGLAQAEFRKGDAAASGATLDRLFAANAGFRSTEADLLAARILEAQGCTREALVAYERLCTIYPGEEAKSRMALLLLKTGSEQRARALFAEVRKSVERGPAFYRRAQRDWYQVARRHA